MDNDTADLTRLVAPLVWERGIVDYSKPLPGMKYVACSTTPHGCWAWWLDGDNSTRTVERDEHHAKAAAQADYAARIIAALDPAALAAMLAAAEQRGREVERQVWLDALDPNICKADYMGEVKMPITAHQWDDDGNEVETTHHVMVDWTAMKEIMAMISAKAAAIRARGVKPAQEGGE